MRNFMLKAITVIAVVALIYGAFGEDAPLALRIALCIPSGIWVVLFANANDPDREKEGNRFNRR